MRAARHSPTRALSVRECSPQSASLVILIALVVMVVATISADAAAEYDRYVAQRAAGVVRTKMCFSLRPPRIGKL